MLVKNITITQLNTVLEQINNLYDNNIVWNRSPEPVGKQFRFTIKVKDNKGKGAKVSYRYASKPRRTASACWHAHGSLFAVILIICPKAIITSSNNLGPIKIYKDSDGCIVGNWTDWNIGSPAYPVPYSASCECGQ